MKPVSILLALTFATSLLPSRVDAQDTPAKLDQTSTLVVKAGESIVAVLPANKARTIDARASDGLAYVAQGLFYKGHVTIVVAITGQTPVTITGDNLSLVPQK